MCPGGLRSCGLEEQGRPARPQERGPGRLKNQEPAEPQERGPQEPAGARDRKGARVRNRQKQAGIQHPQEQNRLAGVREG